MAREVTGGATEGAGLAVAMVRVLSKAVAAATVAAAMAMVAWARAAAVVAETARAMVQAAVLVALAEGAALEGAGGVPLAATRLRLEQL